MTDPKLEPQSAAQERSYYMQSNGQEPEEISSGSLDEPGSDHSASRKEVHGHEASFFQADRAYVHESMDEYHNKITNAKCHARVPERVRDCQRAD